VAANFRDILPVLVAHQVRFIVIGGGAATVHGSARLTQDVDVVYARDPENLARIVAALKAYQPYPRGAPAGLPFQWDERTLHAGLNFTLTTSLGALDLLGEVTGGGSYDHLLPFSTERDVVGVKCHFVNLEKLIELKRAAGRPKDFEVIAELEALLEERRQQEGGS
jgi:predicted nucleotidyltransferase